MKTFKLILIIALVWGCETPEDPPCTCNGEFQINFEDGPVFVKTDVDCETGEPFLSENADKTIIYLGCEE